MENDENIISKNYDVCIVGSGPAGIVQAFQLSKKYNISVLLLELGDNFESKGPLFGIDKINKKSNNFVNIGRSFQYGGSSNLWSGRIANLDLIDFEKREWIDYSGWPFGYKDLAKYYDDALKYWELMIRKELI